jgi:hypothetical protein
MSARAASSALMLSLLIAPGFFRPAQAGPWLPAPGDYYTELRGGLFTAKTYHDDAGDRVGLGGTWEERSLLGTVELGWKKRVSVVVSAPFVSATGLTSMGSTTSTGLEDFRGAIRLGLMQGSRALSVELAWQGPLGYEHESSLFADAIRGGGYQQSSLSLLYGTPITKRAFLQLGAGAGYRSSSDLGLDDEAVIARLTTDVEEHWFTHTDSSWSASPETRFLAAKNAERKSIPLLTSADLGVWLSRSLLLSARYSGVTVMAQQKDFVVPLAYTRPNGSKVSRFGDGVGKPVNPWTYEVSGTVRAMVLAGLALTWRVDDRLDLTAGTWSTAMAKNSLHYDQVYVALTLKQTKLNRLQGFLGGTKAP